jgi:hypothetical protein
LSTVLAWSASSTALWGDTLNVPGDFPSIQTAHDAATSGDTILVAPGTYVGQITITKAITLASHFLPTGDEGFIATTILDGGGAAFVIEIPSSAEDGSTIQGFTIQNADDGIMPRADFNLLNCMVRDTKDGVDYENGSGGLVQFCTFELNSDDGLDLDNDVQLVIADNVIRNNNDDGIEIRMQRYSGPILNITIIRNEIYGNGEDGIQLIHYDVLTNRFFEITYNYIYNNTDAGIGMMDEERSGEDFRAADIPERINIFSNTFANNSHGITGGNNTVVLNNIFVDHPVIAVKKVDFKSVLAFNLFFNNGTDNSGSNLDVDSSVFADPFLTPNLELRARSPAIDAGTALYVWQGTTVLDLPPSAFSGEAPDIGAFEFDRGTSTPPDPPILLLPADGAVDVPLEATLEWTDTADDFDVEAATDPGFLSVAFLTNTGSTTTTLPPGTLFHDTDYYWRVRGNNTFGAGSFSSAFVFTTVPPDTIPPSQPQNLTSPAQTSSTIDLIWEASTDNVGVSFYNIYCGSTLIVSESSTNHTAVGLAPGTSYGFQVSAVDAAGLESLLSDVLTVMTALRPRPRFRPRPTTPCSSK